MAENQLKITWVKSEICTQAHHRGTIKALGLRRINRSVIKRDTPELRGMIRAVSFLLHVEEVK